ncbi:MAG: hypothetical protein ACFCVA_06670 [Gammaproteobacteria bacterium]
MKANRLLDIARAARLAGVPREDIQRLIATGKLTAFEGKVDVSELAKLYPEIERRPASMLELVSQIKEDAIWKAVAPHARDSAPLPVDVGQLRTELAYHKRHAEHYRRMLADLRGMLLDIQEKVDQKQRVEAVIKWLEHKLKEVQ